MGRAPCLIGEMDRNPAPKKSSMCRRSRSSRSSSTARRRRRGTVAASASGPPTSVLDSEISTPLLPWTSLRWPTPSTEFGRRRLSRSGSSPNEIVQSISALREPERRLHGSKFSLAYFPGPMLRTPCGDRFGYLSSNATRNATKLAFNVTNRARLVALGQAMAAPGRDVGADSPIPAGFTYVGQFVDHDVTLDVSSSLDVATDANTIHNMRSPSLDLDSVYGQGPALDPFLYDVPGGNSSAIKLQLGTNLPSGPGGPGVRPARPGCRPRRS